MRLPTLAMRSRMVLLLMTFGLLPALLLGGAFLGERAALRQNAMDGPGRRRRDADRYDRPQPVRTLRRRAGLRPQHRGACAGQLAPPGRGQPAGPGDGRVRRGLWRLQAGRCWSIRRAGAGGQPARRRRPPSRYRRPLWPLLCGAPWLAHALHGEFLVGPEGLTGTVVNRRPAPRRWRRPSRGGWLQHRLCRAGQGPDRQPGRRLGEFRRFRPGRADRRRLPRATGQGRHAGHRITVLDSSGSSSSTMTRWRAPAPISATSACGRAEPGQPQPRRHRRDDARRNRGARSLTTSARNLPGDRLRPQPWRHGFRRPRLVHPGAGAGRGSLRRARPHPGPWAGAGLAVARADHAARPLDRRRLRPADQRDGRRHGAAGGRRSAAGGPRRRPAGRDRPHGGAVAMFRDGMAEAAGCANGRRPNATAAEEAKRHALHGMADRVEAAAGSAVERISSRAAAMASRRRRPGASRRDGGGQQRPGRGRRGTGAAERRDRRRGHRTAFRQRAGDFAQVAAASVTTRHAAGARPGRARR